MMSRGGIEVVDLINKGHPRAWLWPTATGWSFELRKGEARTIGNAQSRALGMLAICDLSDRLYQQRDVFLQFRSPGVARD